jgi:H+/Cl- antiporter ClcA
MQITEHFKQWWTRFKSYGYNLITLSVITGVFVGIVATLYNILTHLGEEYSRNLYLLILQHPAFIPLLFIGLATGAIVIGTVTKFVPMVKGSGIPQIEGASRGMLVFKWYVVLCTMFASSLACVFMGLAAGSEGPSIEMGGCIGEGVGRTLKRSQMIRRLQIAGGASAGFAVAFNAPVTGMIFALEEAFRSFSPQAFICSATSVIVALFVRTGIRYIFGLSTGFAFENFVFSNIPLSSFWYVALASLIVALVAVGFYYLMLHTRSLFKKITFFKGTGKYIIPFVISGAFGLISVYAMGGGHYFIDALATGGTGTITFESLFGIGITATIVIIVIMRFISMTLYMSCGVPCGVFVPMLAVGAGVGAILSLLFMNVGLDGAYVDYLIIICMAVFFVTFVRAPITGICMIFEMTGQLQNFLPALLGITIGYIVSELARLRPGYEKLLDLYVEEQGLLKNAKKVRITLTIQHHASAVGCSVRQLNWPAHGLIVELKKLDGATLVPDGQTVLSEGEQITFECETNDEKQLLEYLYDIVGKPPKEKK